MKKNSGFNEVFTGLFNVHGRIPLGVFRRGVLIALVAEVFYLLVSCVMDSSKGMFVFFVAFYLARSVFLILLAIKRLHDLGKSGILACTLFIPFVGYIVVLYLMFARSVPDNQYGKNPNQQGVACEQTEEKTVVKCEVCGYHLQETDTKCPNCGTMVAGGSFYDK